MITILPMERDEIDARGEFAEDVSGFVGSGGEYCVFDGAPAILALCGRDSGMLDGLVRAVMARAVSDGKLRVYISEKADKSALLSLGFIDHIEDDSINVPLVLGRGCGDCAK